jgi:hypothetical protein
MISLNVQILDIKEQLFELGYLQTLLQFYSFWDPTPEVFWMDNNGTYSR